MEIIDNVSRLQQKLGACVAQKVGFVPTMGALHEGHLTLVRCARAECDVVVVSIFVNPTQFNDPKDLECYPRQLSQDCALLEGVGVDYLFVPSVEQIYPEVDDRLFDLGGVDMGMEGASRPGHFNGVAQVVSRLFDIVKPTVGYFGEKDFQQVAVIRAMVKLLSLEVEIEVVPTVREADGLALSSRNVLLSQQCRAAAPTIYQALKKAQSCVKELSPEETTEAVKSAVEASGVLQVIYFEAVDAVTMQRVESWDDSESIQGCIAVQAGTVRLIDNIKLK